MRPYSGAVSSKFWKEIDLTLELFGVKVNSERGSIQVKSGFNIKVMQGQIFNYIFFIEIRFLNVSLNTVVPLVT